MRSSLGLLLLVHLLAAMADWISPYAPHVQHREDPWTAPTPVVWSGGRLAAMHNGVLYPVQWFQRDERGLHLFSVSAPGRVFLLGTDGLGRDQFSRLLCGARVSLFSGLLAASIAAGCGFLLGTAAGYWGGWTDRVIMRLAELFLTMPWMYLLLAARAFFPLETDPGVVFAALLGLLGVIGWARPARLVRGVVMSVKEREYVLAARGFGASPGYLIRRHIAPETIPVLLTYLTLAIPQYVLAETTLSFLGLGLSGSVPSWGSLIAAMASLEVLTRYWWMMVPAAVMAAVFACYTWCSQELTAGRLRL